MANESIVLNWTLEGLQNGSTHLYDGLSDVEVIELFCQGVQTRFFLLYLVPVLLILFRWGVLTVDYYVHKYSGRGLQERVPWLYRAAKSETILDVIFMVSFVLAMTGLFL